MLLVYDLEKIKLTQKRTGIENSSDCCMRNSNLDNQIWKILLFGLHLHTYARDFLKMVEIYAIQIKISAFSLHFFKCI